MDVKINKVNLTFSVCVIVYVWEGVGGGGGELYSR